MNEPWPAKLSQLIRKLCLRSRRCPGQLRKRKNRQKGSKSAKQGNFVCHYCKQEGLIVRKREKWIADGKPPKPAKNVQNSQYSSPGSDYSAASMIAVDSEVYAADDSAQSDS
jgi:hypothetical protein